jgi:hypothetical protein
MRLKRLSLTALFILTGGSLLAQEEAHSSFQDLFDSLDATYFTEAQKVQKSTSLGVTLASDQGNIEFNGNKERMKYAVVCMDKDCFLKLSRGERLSVIQKFNGTTFIYVSLNLNLASKDNYGRKPRIYVELIGPPPDNRVIGAECFKEPIKEFYIAPGVEAKTNGGIGKCIQMDDSELISPKVASNILLNAHNVNGDDVTRIHGDSIPESDEAVRGFVNGMVSNFTQAFALLDMKLHLHPAPNFFSLYSLGSTSDSSPRPH